MPTTPHHGTAIPVRFQTQTLRAECLPELGGRLSALVLAVDGTERDLIVPMQGWPDLPFRWPKTGAYPLFPFSNRIRDARLAHAGRTVALKPHPDAIPHVLHGPAQLRPWRCLAQDATSATLGLDYASDDDWPWPFHADQQFRLTDDGLTITLTITNTGHEPFPAGFGWHPYFTFPPGAVLHHDARTLWMQDAHAIATGVTAAAEPPHARTEYLSDWTSAAIEYADGLQLEVTADAAFVHLVCHRPDNDAYACIEPVTHVADGFNLAEQGIANTGTLVLAPGATESASIRLRLRRSTVKRS